jgi:hypothetical protein
LGRERLDDAFNGGCDTYGRHILLVLIKYLFHLEYFKCSTALNLQVKTEVQVVQCADPNYGGDSVGSNRSRGKMEHHVADQADFQTRPLDRWLKSTLAGE